LVVSLKDTHETEP